MSAAAWLRSALGAATGRRPPFALCYHGVGAPAGADPHGLFVSAEMFAAQLDALAGAGYELVGAAELWQRIGAGRGEGVGAITFDDALAQTAETAAPLLAARGMRASMYVATGLLGGDHPDVGGERIMRAAEVAELAAAGWEIGAHSVGHRVLPQLDDAALAAELRDSREALEQLLGAPVTTMAYPYGAHDERVVAATRAAGYELACACSGSGPWEPLRLPREPVFPGTSPLRLRLKAAGLYGPVHRVLDLRSMMPAVASGGWPNIRRRGRV